MFHSLTVLAIFAAALAGTWMGDVLWPEGRAVVLWPSAAAWAMALWAALRWQRGTVVIGLMATAWLFAGHGAQQVGPSPPSPLALTNTEALWHVRVCTTPSQTLPKGPKRGVRAQVALLAQQRDGQFMAEQGRADLTLWQGPTVARGDELIVRLQVQALRDVAPPWGDSQARFMRRHGVSAQALVCAPHVLTRPASGLWAASDHARQRAAAHLQQLLPPAVAGIAQALALGDTQGIGPEQRDAWGDAGMAHLLAVSGLHVGLVARVVRGSVWALLALWPSLAERTSLRRWASLAALPFVWAYALFTGGAISALRAGVMVTLVLLAHVQGLSGNQAAHALGIAGAALLWLDPSAAQSASFWLSFVSVACLLGTPLLGWGSGQNSKIAPARGQNLLGRVARAAGAAARLLGSALVTGLVAALGTAPLCALFFGRLSVVAPATNLLAVPLGGIVATPLSLATVLLSAWLPPAHPLVRGCALLCRQALLALDLLARRAAQLPYAALQVSPAVLACVSAGCTALLCAWATGLLRRHAVTVPWLSPLPLAERMSLGLVASTLCAGAIYGQARLNAQQQPDVLTLWHLDVAQGDSTLIGLPKGGWVLVDGGGASFAGQSDPGRWAVARALRALHITRLRAVVLTHPHPDHMGGLSYVLQRWPTDVFLRSQEAHEEPFVRGLEDSVRRLGGRVELPAPTLQWGGVSVRAFMPLLHRKASVNDHSIVLELTYGTRRALFAGDAEAAAEADILPHLRPVDVLKVGHHGSRTSSSPAFVQAVQPHLAIISCGPNNRFGHPHEATLQTFAQHNVRVLRTDELGPIMLRSNGSEPFTWQVRHQELSAP